MDSKTRAGIIAIAVIVIVIALSVIRSYLYPSSVPASTYVSYLCDQGKTIVAIYSEGQTKPPTTPDGPPIPGGSANVTLSDGRTMTLHQTISADGVRYANSDESFVFWNKGNDVLVLENNQQTSYTGCTDIKAIAKTVLQ